MLDSIRMFFAQCVFNTQCQYCAYHRYENKFKNCNLFVYISSSMTILIFILHIIALEINSNSMLSILAILSLLVTGCGLVYTMISSKLSIKEMYNHKFHAEKYKSLRDDFLCLIEEVMSNESMTDDLRLKRDDLMKRYSSIGEAAPSTDNTDYKNTQNSLGLLGKGEVFTWNNDEIDKFLPNHLRLSQI